MITINDAIMEAQADEMAEREVNAGLKPENQKRSNTIKPYNTVTLDIDEYMRLYMATEKYYLLLGVIARNAEPCSYKPDNMRLKDENDIINFVKFNEMEVFAVMLKDCNTHAKEKQEGK